MKTSAAFKRLARNDTAGAPGHQAGILIPKDLASYFPQLGGNPTPSTPTVDIAIQAELRIGKKTVATVQTRYQHQTWHATRRPERRITGALRPITEYASPGDYVVFHADSQQSGSFRITLIRAGTAEYSGLANAVAGRKWGRISSASLAKIGLA